MRVLSSTNGFLSVGRSVSLSESRCHVLGILEASQDQLIFKWQQERVRRIPKCPNSCIEVGAIFGNNGKTFGDE